MGRIEGVRRGFADIGMLGEYDLPEPVGAKGHGIVVVRHECGNDRPVLVLEDTAETRERLSRALVETPIEEPDELVARFDTLFGPPDSAEGAE